MEIQIHRTGRVADWDAIPHSQRNRWQRMAANTHGYVAPGNVVSIVGATLSVLGFVYVYQEALMAGLVAVAIGRLCDVLDGYVAHYSGTKSTVGETVDAGLDKLVMFVAFLVLAGTELVPFLPLVLLGIQQLIAGALGMYARLKGLHMHPSPLGKYSAISQWGVLLAYILAAALGGTSENITATLYTLLLGATAAGYVATYGYASFVAAALRRRGLL